MNTRKDLLYTRKDLLYTRKDLCTRARTRPPLLRDAPNLHAYAFSKREGVGNTLLNAVCISLRIFS